MNGIPDNLKPLVAAARSACDGTIAAHAQRVDADACWPAESMRALADAGLMGLNVPVRLGGHGQGMVALSLICETVAGACSSTAMCYAMHCVATAVIAAKATPDQEERYLRPIAAGRHICTLSLSETATGSQFYFPQTKLKRMDDGFLVTGEKAFVTNGGHADSYVVSAESPSGAAGDFSCLLVDRDAGMQWLDPWRGFGMRGNSSRGMRLADVHVPRANLLGAEGDQVWYVFEVVAPFFIMGMAGTYLGVATSALDATIQHLRARTHATGDALAQSPVIQQRLAELYMDLQRTRALVHAAALAGDNGEPDALPLILSAKVAAAETAVALTNGAMTLCGGIGYRDDARLSRLLRDARAAPVMAPTSDQLRAWTARALLGLPLL